MIFKVVTFINFIQAVYHMFNDEYLKAIYYVVLAILFVVMFIANHLEGK